MKLGAIKINTSFAAKKYGRRPSSRSPYGDGYYLGFNQGIVSQKPKNGINDDYITSSDLNKLAKSMSENAGRFKKGYLRGHMAGSEAAKRSLDAEV